MAGEVKPTTDAAISEIIKDFLLPVLTGAPVDSRAALEAAFADLAKPYRFATIRVRQPFTGVAAAAGSLYTVASNRFYTAGYEQTGLRICIPNCWFPQTATAPFEIAGDAGRVIEGASLKLAGTYYPLTFNGQGSFTFGAEKYVWSDPLPLSIPANSAIDIIVADYCPLGIRRPRSYNPANGLYGDLGAGAATSLWPLLVQQAGRQFR